MCLMNGKNHDGGIHPLDISVPLSCASASHSHSAVLFFFLLRAGPPAPAPAMPKIPLNKRAPSACPYFYILADERRGNRRVKCGHFTSDCGRNFRPRARRHVHVLLAISLIHRAALCYSMPATKMQRLFSSPKHRSRQKS